MGTVSENKHKRAKIHSVIYPQHTHTHPDGAFVFTSLLLLEQPRYQALGWFDGADDVGGANAAEEQTQAQSAYQ